MPRVAAARRSDASRPNGIADVFGRDDDAVSVPNSTDTHLSHAQYSAVMSLLPIADVDFDRRWAEWQERGRVHSRQVNARLRIALPLTVLIVVAGYLFLVR